MNPIKHASSFPFVKPVILLVGAIAVWASPAFALDGQVGIHDPSTLMLCDGKWYTYGTGGNPLVSDDGWTWRRGVVPARTGAAPDVIHIGDRYFMYISGVTMIWSKSLDPCSPDYKWEDGGRIAGLEFQGDFVNPIDPGAFLDPTTGKLWLTYGSYVGYTRVVELDPKTGKRVDNKYANVAVNCEATDMIYHDGWYYLLGTHGSCCAGANSGYNIRVGRSKSPTGPFIDNMGIDMMEGGGKLLCGSGGRYIGPGHFGLIDLGDGVQKFSFHWEADLDRGGASVVDVLPLLWKDGWPIAGENFKAGTYEIESVRTGTALEMAVEGQAVGGGRGRGGPGGAPGAAGPGGRGADANAAGAFGGRMGGMTRGGAMGGRGGDANAAGGFGRGMGGMARGGNAPADANGAAMAGRGGAGGRRGGGMGMGGGGGMFGGTGRGPVADQNAVQVSANWPTGNVDIRMSNYMCQAQQKWTVAPAPNAGGYLGGPFFKITIAGTDRTLAVGDDGELVVLSSFTGGPRQLWRIDQFTDGTWRVMPKFASDAKESLYLSAVGSSFATLAKFDPASDKQRWYFKAP